MKTSNETTKLVKVLADVTKRSVYVGMIFFVCIVVFCIYGIAAFVVPDTFIELKGKERCDPSDSKKGLCHTYDYTEENVWVAYLGKFEAANQYMVIGGEFMKKEDITEKNFLMEFQIEIFPVDNYGDLTFDSEDFKHIRNHKLDIQC